MMDLEFGPLGCTPREADAFVRTEIERSLPPGWCVTGLDQDSPPSGTNRPDDGDPDGVMASKFHEASICWRSPGATAIPAQAEWSMP